MPNQQQAPRPPGKDPKQREDFYANIGEAIRTLKAEIPRLFQEDLTCEFSLRRFYPVTSKVSCYHLTLIPESCTWNCEPPLEIQHGHFARQQVYIAEGSQMFGLRLRDKSEIWDLKFTLQTTSTGMTSSSETQGIFFKARRTIRPFSGLLDSMGSSSSGFCMWTCSESGSRQKMSRTLAQYWSKDSCLLC